MSPGTWWLLAGYAGLAGFFILEAATRKPGTASSLDTSRDDQGTTRLIVIAYGLAAFLPLLLRWVPAGHLPLTAAPIGLIFQTTGLCLRGWSMRTLGRFYSRTLRTEGDQHAVIKTGPYRLIRHPGYTGSLLIWTGFALASCSAPGIAIVVGLLGWAYHRRISAEEQLLRRTLSGYTAYTRETKRLIPFLW